LRLYYRLTYLNGVRSSTDQLRPPRTSSITVQTFYRWRKEYGGLKMDQAKRLKELEKENGKLKRLVAELLLDKQILKDIAEGNF
jgi:putative transposase